MLKTYSFRIGTAYVQIEAHTKPQALKEATRLAPDGARVEYIGWRPA